MKRTTLRRLAAAAILAATSAVTWGQASPWPTRAVHILVGFPAGSTPDSAARALADGLAGVLGQPVIVENRPGSSGNLAANLVAKATDDHTIGVVINGNLTTAKVLNPALPYDPSRDLSYLSLLTTAPLALVTPSSNPEGAAFFRAASTRCCRAASIVAPRLAVTCTAGSEGNTLGTAYSTLSASTSRMTKYFQRAYSSIAGPRARPLGPAP